MGSAFFAVGVAHLKGVITFLSQKGNQITPINCSQRPAIWGVNFSEVLGDSRKSEEHQSITSVIPKAEENTISSSEKSPRVSLRIQEPSARLEEALKGEQLTQELQPTTINQSVISHVYSHPSQSKFFTPHIPEASSASVNHSEIEKSKLKSSIELNRKSDNKINSSVIKDEQESCSSICIVL